MARFRLRKPSYTLPLPPGAKIITKNGKDVARFTTKRGRTITAELTHDGQRCRLQARRYIGEYLDYAGKLHKVKLSGDHLASREQLRKLARKAAKKPTDFETHAGRPLVDHLEDYRQDLLAEGNGQ